jgi:hypothetical protein
MTSRSRVSPGQPDTGKPDNDTHVQDGDRVTGEHPRPAVCAADGSAQVEPHCANPQCPWVKCKCGAVTGIVEGQPHVSGTSL